MRRYIRKEDLQRTLQSILSRQDQELLDIYREVVLYHVTRNGSTYKHAARSLALPGMVKLSLFNLMTIPAAAVLLQYALPSFWIDKYAPAAFAALLFFALRQFYVLFRCFQRYEKSRPYLLVDELIERKIIILQKKPNTPAPAGSQLKFKAAK